MAAPKHSGRAHALLSASAAHRWMQCTPSAVLESGEPDKGSVFAAEGTLAHEVCEVVLRAALSRTTYDLSDLRAREGFTEEMEEHAEAYADYVLSQVVTDDALVEIEAKLDFSEYVLEGFGTGDCVIAQDGVLTIIDYKYGKGVKVRAEKNPQMMLYALGAVKAFDFVYEFDTVHMVIFQPRLESISEWSLSMGELEAWAEKTLAPKAKEAAKGEGKFQPGDHCRFCKYSAKCKVLAAYCMATASKDFEDEDGILSEAKLDPWDWNIILDRMDIVESWLKKVKAAATEKLLADPESIPGYKVVAGRSNRVYSNTAEVAKRLTEAGYSDEVIYKPREVAGITEMTKRLGKAKAAELLDGLIIKPEGKPTLVPVTDKRPLYKGSAEVDFTDEGEM